MQKSNIYEFPLVGLSLGCLSEMDTALESTNRKLLQGKIEKTLFSRRKILRVDILGGYHLTFI